MCCHSETSAIAPIVAAVGLSLNIKTVTAWTDTDLVFTMHTGLPVGPQCRLACYERCRELLVYGVGEGDGGRAVVPEVEVQALPRHLSVLLEVRSNDANNRVADLAESLEGEPLSPGSIRAGIGLVRHPQVGAQHIDAGLPVLLPVISQPRMAYTPASLTTGGLSLPSCPAAAPNRSFNVLVRCSARLRSSCFRCSCNARAPRRGRHHGRAPRGPARRHPGAP
jgi:hypothetical protein